jgi:hypothetical protein
MGVEMPYLEYASRYEPWTYLPTHDLLTLLMRKPIFKQPVSTTHQYITCCITHYSTYHTGIRFYTYLYGGNKQQAL